MLRNVCVQSYAYVANENTNGLCVQDKAVSASQKSEELSSLSLQSHSKIMVMGSYDH